MYTTEIPTHKSEMEQHKQTGSCRVKEWARVLLRNFKRLVAS
ncbi:hypothetical protein SLEP1_g3588 [Rubroshorea leprosula]|uniref:Uncharacterized protein n=1 Tax=Rubroshorea leprosula TaxID=152421 RepID=A0AAV5HWD5_9ROSI|nr:hypothetical protein SLEP1_g3588 [Rubroshorea leprosula]